VTAEAPRLAVSNVAWTAGDVDGFLELASSLKCDGVELAGSMIWKEPVETPPEERRALKWKIEERGLKTVGIQALLFSRPDLMIFGSVQDRRDVLDYFAGLMDFCADVGGETLVFGSPRNRRRGAVPPEEARRITLDFFREVGRMAAERGVVFCLEPLGTTETDFINSVTEAERLLEDLGDPPGLGLHIDTKALIDANEVDSPALTRSFSRARHVHVTDPGLQAPGSTGFDHRRIRDRMRGSGYSRYLSLEMRRQDPDPAEAIRRAVDYMRKVYFHD
jgi:sugar phosphate isomerase/epimerase